MSSIRIEWPDSNRQPFPFKSKIVVSFALVTLRTPRSTSCAPVPRNTSYGRALSWISSPLPGVHHGQTGSPDHGKTGAQNVRLVRDDSRTGLRVFNNAICRRDVQKIRQRIRRESACGLGETAFVVCFLRPQLIATFSVFGARSPKEGALNLGPGSSAGNCKVALVGQICRGRCDVEFRLWWIRIAWRRGVVVYEIVQ